jgi:hypothetical protein
MDTPFSGAIRRPKRKLSTQSDLRNSSLFSQNSSISTPAKKKKRLSSFSQSQPTQFIQKTPTYSESPIFEDSESAVEMQKNQIFVETLKETSFDFSQDSTLPTPIYSRTPLGPKDTNIQLSQTITDYIRKPDQKISWGCVKKWQKSQPNDHTSKYSLFYLYYLYYLLY